jgi:hypothetical protein
MRIVIGGSLNENNAVELNHLLRSLDVDSQYQLNCYIDETAAAQHYDTQEEGWLLLYVERSEIGCSIGTTGSAGSFSAGVYAELENDPSKVYCVSVHHGLPKDTPEILTPHNTAPISVLQPSPADLENHTETDVASKSRNYHVRSSCAKARRRCFSKTGRSRVGSFGYEEFLVWNR